MRLKTYTAATMAKAMELVRLEMGEDAIIVATQPGADGRGARVTAALDDVDAHDALYDDWSEAAEEEQIPPGLGDEIADCLAFHNVPRALAGRLTRAAQPFLGEGPVMALASAFDALFAFAPLADAAARKPVMLVGPPGVGKTIAIAKLATRLRRSEKPVVVISTDTKRAGGVEQLRAFTDILGVNLHRAASVAELADIARRPRGGTLLIDTFGTNPFSAAEMETLSTFAETARAEPVLVLAAGTDPEEALEMADAFAALGARKLLITRVDLARRMGCLMAAADLPGYALSEISISPHVADGLIPLNPVSLARLILPEPSAPEFSLHPKEAAR